jgi:hypothetical protein
VARADSIGMSIRDNAAPNARGRPESAPDTLRLDAEYVLPLRWSAYRANDVRELTEYLTDLREWLSVTVVDGSPDSVFAAHHAPWGDLVRHVRPDGSTAGNGKVAGVLTGIRLARSRSVILADDDVRYDRAGLERMVAELQRADLVRPQNFFSPLPWHARWDTARSLLNRAVASDYPGTLGVNRDLVLALGGYDGEVAQPPRLALELALLPMLVFGVRRPLWLAGIAVASIALAEGGRRRANGRRVYPPTSALWAPGWLLERAVCVWVAIGERMLGGARYRNTRLKKAATSSASLRRAFERRNSRL